MLVDIYVHVNYKDYQYNEKGWSFLSIDARYPHNRMSILGRVLVKDAIQDFYLTTNDAITLSQIPSLQNKYTHRN